MRKPTRRQVLSQIAASATLAAVGSASAAPATTTTAATTQRGFTEDDLAAANRVLAHPYTPEENAMALENLSGKREIIQALRERAIDPNLEPAIQFNPRLPAQPVALQPFSSIENRPLINVPADLSQLAFASAADLSRLIHAKKISSVALTRMYLDRLKTAGRKLNAVITLMEDAALKQAQRMDDELAAGNDRGPLHGLPYGAKDCFATKNAPTTWGVEVWKDRVFDHDATVIANLADAGAVLCAKLSLGELCMGDVWFGGMTRCPWDPKEGSSGSSAGPCATVAAGCVAFAIGTETLGSIVSPCMVNGTVGLRPTYGRVSRFGAMPLARTMDKVGPIARSAEDLPMILHAIAGPDGNDPTAFPEPFAWHAIDTRALRVGYDPAAFDPNNGTLKKFPELRAVYESSLDRLRRLVGNLTPITLPPPERFKGLASFIIACESSSNFSELLHTGRIRELAQQDAGSWPNVFRVGSVLPAADYLRAMQARAQLQREMHEAMKNVDLYVTIPYAGPTIAYTNLTGHPNLVLRAGAVRGRPKLIEFIGQPYREDVLLQLGQAFEQTDPALTTLWPSI